MENLLLKRKTIRIKDYDYSNEGMYFITICTKDKKPILSKIIFDTVGNRPTSFRINKPYPFICIIQCNVDKSCDLIVIVYVSSFFE